MADLGLWDARVPRSGSESSLSGTQNDHLGKRWLYKINIENFGIIFQREKDLEAVGEDAKICNNSMIALVHIFSVRGLKYVLPFSKL